VETTLPDREGSADYDYYQYDVDFDGSSGSIGELSQVTNKSDWYYVLKNRMGGITGSDLEDFSKNSTRLQGLSSPCTLFFTQKINDTDTAKTLVDEYCKKDDETAGCTNASCIHDGWNMRSVFMKACKCGYEPIGLANEPFPWWIVWMSIGIAVGIIVIGVIIYLVIRRRGAPGFAPINEAHDAEWDYDS